MRTARGVAGVLLLLALAGCSEDETGTPAGSGGPTESAVPTQGAPPAEPAVQIAEAPAAGPYEVGDVIPPGEPAPHEARRDAAEGLAAEHDRDYVWVTDAYTLAQGGEVVEAYYAVDATGEIAERLREEWMTFDDPDEALAYAEEVVAEASEPERYDVVPLEP